MSKKSFQYCKAQQLSKKVFKSEDEALIYFSRIGRCVGNKMDKEVTAYKINSQKCKDVRLWL